MIYYETNECFATVPLKTQNQDWLLSPWNPKVYKLFEKKIEIEMKLSFADQNWQQHKQVSIKNEDLNLKWRLLIQEKTSLWKATFTPTL